MTKGPPDKILRHCINISYLDIEKVLSKSLKEGYKIIACASKIIQYNQYDKNKKEEYYLNNLVLCGFILLKNTLKEQSKQIVKNIKKMECDIAISTGDSLYNSIGTGLKIELFNNKNIFAFDLNMMEKKTKIYVSSLGNNKKDEEKTSDRDIKTLQENIEQNFVLDKLDENFKENIISNKKTFTKMQNPINNNSLINDNLSSSRRILTNKDNNIE